MSQAKNLHQSSKLRKQSSPFVNSLKTFCLLYCPLPAPVCFINVVHATAIDKAATQSMLMRESLLLSHCVLTGNTVINASSYNIACEIQQTGCTQVHQSFKLGTSSLLRHGSNLSRFLNYGSLNNNFQHKKLYSPHPHFVQPVWESTSVCASLCCSLDHLTGQR